MSEKKINHDPDFIPSQTPESEDFTSQESSILETPIESDCSLATSSQCSGSTDYNSSYFTDSQSSVESDDYFIEQTKLDGPQPTGNVKI